MKRVVLPLAELDRRSFCRAFAVGAAGAMALSACAEDGDAVQTGPVGSEPPDQVGPDAGDPNSPDAGHVTTPDAAPTPIDAAPSGPTCGTGAVDVGAPTSFASGTATLISASSVFIVRDAGGLYAVSSRCTHENATNGVSSGRFRCPRHGALFNFDGSIISGPVSQPLKHYALCTMSNGHVGVDKSQVVSTSTRLDV
ncbi:MAG: Rieske (2Fe-2S) protein [Myxococcales bacterium]|nr:Rieske (2Fe-2S) protein [Myxococcales bacterium]